MFKFITPDPMAPDSKEARQRDVELIVSRFRWGIAIFVLLFAWLRRGPLPELSWAAVGLFLISCVFATIVLRRRLTLGQLRALGIFVIMTDVVLLTVSMLSDTGRVEVALWSAGLLVIFEGAVRWFLVGSVSSAVAMSGSTAIWMAYRSAHSDFPFSPSALLFRSVILVFTGLALGVIVQALEQARGEIARRLAESEVVNRFALRAPEMNEAEAIHVLARMLHDDLGFERVLIQLHDPDSSRLRPMAFVGFATSSIPVTPDITDFLNGLADDDPRSLCARCFSGGRPIIANRSDRLGGFGIVIPHDPVQAKLAVPMRAGGRILGVLEVSSKSRDAFDDDDAQLLESLASELAQVIENARLSEMQRETIGELQRLASMKEDFIAIASHELRGPITALRGFARALASPQVTPDRERQAVEVINRQIDRLGALVEDLLTVSLIDSGGSDPSLEAVDLGKIAREVVEEAGVNAGNRHFRVDVPADLPLAVADPQYMRRVLVNLVSNAVKYSPDGGPIEVRARRCSQAVRIDVRDHGIGIREVDQARIFEKFTRVRNKGGPGGTGLGLYIVYGLVEAMSGTVEVTSSPAEGSRFSVTLPSARQTEPDVATVVDPGARSSNRRSPFPDGSARERGPEGLVTPTRPTRGWTS